MSERSERATRSANSPYRLLFDRALVRVDAESAHHTAMSAIRAARPVLSRWPAPSSPRTVMGIEFPSALGLAAGFDKNAVAIDSLAGLGFGFVEIGTVTGEAQPGNPRPRLMRLPADRAVINRMGFNNDGSEVVGARLAARRRRLKGRRGPVLGVNIGKTKVVPENDQDAVIADYQKSVTHLAPYADYLVVNVSSPNTPGLRDLQAVEKLEPLLRAVRLRADEVVADRHLPLVVKIAPDLSDEDVLAVADLAVALELDGIIATNTTISREGLVSTSAQVEAAGGGGLSGAPLKERAQEVMGLLRGRVGDLALIGVGGIGSAEDARARLDAGADLLQAYTAFIYEGPLWPRRINRALAGKGK